MPRLKVTVTGEIQLAQEIADALSDESNKEHEKAHRKMENRVTLGPYPVENAVVTFDGDSEKKKK